MGSVREIGNMVGRYGFDDDVSCFDGGFFFWVAVRCTFDDDEMLMLWFFFASMSWVTSFLGLVRLSRDVIIGL